MLKARNISQYYTLWKIGHRVINLTQIWSLIGSNDYASSDCLWKSITFWDRNVDYGLSNTASKGPIPTRDQNHSILVIEIRSKKKSIPDFTADESKEKHCFLLCSKTLSLLPFYTNNVISPNFTPIQFPALSVH